MNSRTLHTDLKSAQNTTEILIEIEAPKIDEITSNVIKNTGNYVATFRLPVICDVLHLTDEYFFLNNSCCF